MAEKKAKAVEEVEVDKEKSLENTVAQIEKTFGKGAIMKLDDSFITDVEVIPTGCLTLDTALGIGGMPRGRIIEVYGPESSGKTTVCLHVIAEAQRLGGTAAFIDAEHAIDPRYARLSALSSTNYSFRNQITANKRWISWKRWCVRAR